jgi:hypothetical protein
MKRHRVLGVGMALILTPLFLFGFGPGTVKRLTEVSLRLAPPSLRSPLLAYRTQLDRGVAEALAGFSTASPERIAAEAAGEYALIPKLPSQRMPFEVIAYHFGRLAGLIFLINDPLAAGSDARAGEVHLDYLAYVERKLPLMMFAFDGYGTPPMGADLEGYLIRRSEASKRYREAVLFCYFPEGRRVSSSTFDDRSNAFGVAQVALSHAASDTAKAWLNCWRAMDGDLAATPYYDPGKAGR